MSTARTRISKEKRKKRMAFAIRQVKKEFKKEFKICKVECRDGKKYRTWNMDGQEPRRKSDLGGADIYFGIESFMFISFHPCMKRNNLISSPVILELQACEPWKHLQHGK